MLGAAKLISAITAVNMSVSMIKDVDSGVMRMNAKFKREDAQCLFVQAKHDISSTFICDERQNIMEIKQLVNWRKDSVYRMTA